MDEIRYVTNKFHLYKDETDKRDEIRSVTDKLYLYEDEEDKNG